MAALARPAPLQSFTRCLSVLCALLGVYLCGMLVVWLDLRFNERRIVDGLPGQAFECVELAYGALLPVELVYCGGYMIF